MNGPIAILGGALVTTNAASLTTSPGTTYAFTIDSGTLMSAPNSPANGFSARFASLAIGPGGATIRSDQRTDNFSVISGTSPTASLTYGTTTGTASGVIMVIGGNNTYAGGTVLEGGLAVVVGNNAAFGTGTLELAGALIRSRTAPQSLANLVTISANTQFNASSAQPNLTFTGPVTLAGGSRAFQVDSVHTSGTSAGQPGVIFTNEIGDGGSGHGLTKTGAGVLLLSGNNTYGGATTVSAGTLVVNGDQSSATGAVGVAAFATLMGSGTIGGETTVSGLHSPGNSPGVQTFASDLSYSGGGSTVLWELTGNTATNSPVAYDQVAVGGDLDFAGLTTLSLSFNAAGSSVDWSDPFWSEERVWTLYAVAGETTNFGNLGILGASWLDSQSQSLGSVRAGSTFSLRQDGENVSIVYAVVPEPAAVVIAGIGAVLIGMSLARRRRPPRRSP
jgi:autotransporter-associated beta strand protein